MLTDTDIERILSKDEVWAQQQGTLHIYPYADRSMTPVGYDLRVGPKYASSLRSGPIDVETGQAITIHPGETVLITTLETVGMPKGKMLSGLITSKVSLVSKGLSHISTTLDPDWEGPLLITLNNLGRSSVKLMYGDAFATAVFFQNVSAATRSVNRPAGRLDVFMDQWASQARVASRRERLFFFAQPGVVLLSLAVGLLLFGNSAAAAASVAVGVAISQVIGHGRTGWK